MSKNTNLLRKLSFFFIIMLFLFVSSSFLVLGEESSQDSSESQQTTEETQEESDSGSDGSDQDSSSESSAEDTSEQASETESESTDQDNPEENDAEQEETTSDTQESTEVFIDLEEIIDPAEEQEESLNQDERVIEETEEPEITDIEIDPVIDEPTILITKKTEKKSKTSKKPIKTTKKEVAQVFYKNNKKEIETTIEEGRQIAIKKSESIQENSQERWEKEVTVSSDEHFENELTVFANIKETEKDNIKLFWREESEFLDFETFDEDENGLVERISWIVPHLSEQNFEIIIDFTETENSDTEISLTATNSPSAVTNSPVNFNFDVIYYNLSAINCDFSLTNDEGTSFVDESLEVSDLSYSVDLTNDDYLWSLSCHDQNSPEISNSTSGSFTVDVDYTPTIDFSVDKNTINEDETVTFSVDIITAVESSIVYNLDLGDGDSLFNPPISSSQINDQVSHVYSTHGTYEAVLEVYIDGSTTPEERTLSITVNEDTSQSNDEDDPPTITLIDPDDDEVISEDQITFTYRANDDTDLANCTFNLYYYNNSAFGNLAYTTTEDDIENDEEVSIDLVDFDAGEYSWEVECYDSSNNYEDKSRDFIFSTTATQETISSTTQQEIEFEDLDEQTIENLQDIDTLIDAINEFFVNEEKYDPAEREVVEDLEIIGDLKFYKKKLLQSQLDLKHNLDYISDTDRKETRKEEILEEIEDIKKEVPKTVTIRESNEYYKNSLELDMEDIVTSYLEAKNIVLDKSEIKNMAKQNEKIQNQITVSVKVRQVELEYLENTDEITLVTKEIDFKNKSFDSIIEVIPKEVANSASEITFINEHNVIEEDPIFEIKLDDIKEDKIVYSLNKFVSPSEVEKTLTLSFKEDVPKSRLGAISGFATFAVSDGISSFWFYVSWLLFLAIFGIILILAVSKTRVKMWQKNEDFKKTYKLLNSTKKDLKNKEVESAKQKYKEIRTLYTQIPNKSKKFVVKKIGKLQIEIDKKDIINILKEFSLAVKENRKEEALALYEDIQLIYHRMPKKYQKKVYQKVIPKVKELQR